MVKQHRQRQWQRQLRRTFDGGTSGHEFAATAAALCFTTLRLTSTSYRALLKKAEVEDALLMVVVVLALRQILQ